MASRLQVRVLCRPKGQALVLTLVFAAAAGLVGLLLFNTGLLANAKTRLQNAADAAAYSAGVLQARDHNFSAYTNRAMIANQASVAQIVSMKSYLEDATDTYDRMGGVLLSVQAQDPMSKPMWDYGLQVAGPAVSRTDSIFSSVASDYTAALDALIRAHETAQSLHHTATFADVVAVADEVIQKNDPQARMSTGSIAVGNAVYQVSEWSASTEQHSANDSSAEADRFADLVVSNKSTDRFTRNRISRPVPAWFNETSSFCLVTRAGVNSSSNFAFVHAGGTILSEDKKRWLALDATLGGGGYSCTYWSVCGTLPCLKTDFTPFNDGVGGSGGGLVGEDGDYEIPGYRSNPTETMLYGQALLLAKVPALLRYSNGPGSSLDTSGGLQDYYRDMADPTGRIPANATPEENGGRFPITIEVERPASTIRTSSKLLTGSSIIRLDDQLAGDKMRAMASAHAYFYRPTSNSGMARSGWSRGDGKTELANLFSPYWQARLIDTTPSERAGSLADQIN